MTPEQQAALDKIKKLLRMQRGGTPGEIENALAAAARLAREHGIDHQDVPYGSTRPVEMDYAVAIVINFFNVSVIIIEQYSRRTAWLFRDKKAPRFIARYIGTEWDIEIGRYVFHFLVDHFRRSWRLRENRRLSNRRAFLHGMFIGLCTKLREAQPLEPQSQGLIHLERARRRAYLEKLHPNAKDRNLPEEDSEATAARYAGYVAGKNTTIRKGVDRGERGERLLA